MSSSYRALLARRGARPLALACAVSWLSFGGYILAVILSVHSASGSFAVAGAVVAVVSVGISALAPVRGRLVDRRGTRAALPLVAAHLVGGALLLAGCVGGYRPGLVFSGAALFGVSAPPLIGVARAQWTQLAGPDLARTGHALNSALADVAGIASPAFVAAVSLLVSPQAALGFLMVGVLSAALLLFAGSIAAPTTETATPPVTGLWGVLHDSAGLRTLVVCDLAIGAWVAAIDVSLTALAGSHGSPELAAVPLAGAALGSIVMSLWAGRAGQTRTPAWRYLIGLLTAATSLAVSLAVSLIASSIALITLTLIPAGAGFGLLNAAAFELLDLVSGPERATEAFTWLTTAAAAGGAVGSLTAGRLAQTDATSGLLLTVTLATAALTIAFLLRHTLPPTANAQLPD